MPQLDTLMNEVVPQSTLIYGASLTGKTTLAMTLAKKYKVLYVDGENGTPALLKLPPEYRKNIFVQRVLDHREDYNFIHTCIFLASGGDVELCDAHGRIMNKPKVCPPCRECSAKRTQAGVVNKWKLNDLATSEWVVVFDSFTQLSNSANALVTRSLTGELEFEEFKHWRAQGTYLQKFLDYIQTARYHSVTISHEQMTKMPDGSSKLVPSGGTNEFAAKIPRHFNNVIYTGVKNKKHTITARTIDAINVMAGTRDNKTVIDPTSVETMTKGMLEIYQ